MDKKLISETLYKHTSGYPFLVSKLCKTIAEDLGDDWTVDGIHKAINDLLDQKNTLFDDLIKNVDNVPSLNEVVTELLLSNEDLPYNIDDHEIGVMYSILKNVSGKVKMHNPIFATRIYNYIISVQRRKNRGMSDYSTIPFGNPDGSLDIERALTKFQEYYKSVYSTLDKKFIEREGRLLLIAFFKPIVNGTGFYFVEAQSGYEKRQDLVITFNGFKYIIELKIWRGDEYHQAGLKQLAGYLDLESQEKGYLVCFNFNKGKEYKSAQIECDGKNIFAIWV